MSEVQITQEIDAAFFDIDRTLITPDTQQLHPGLADVLDPSSRRFSFTEITARGILQYQQALHDNPALMPSETYPVGLEYGTQIVVSDDYRNSGSYESIHHTALTADEQQELGGYLEEAPFIFAAFYASDPTVPRTLWLSEATREEDVAVHNKDKMLLRRGPTASLMHAVEDAQPGMVVVRAKEFQQELYESMSLVAHTTSFSKTTTIDFLPANSDKRDAALYMESLLGLQRERLLLAGDSLPDLGMLAIEGATSIVVHNPKVDPTAFPPHALRVAPANLASLLASL